MSGVALAQSQSSRCYGVYSANWTNCWGSTTDSYGNKYEGDFQYGKFEGNWVEFFANRERYVGEYKDGKFYGRGTLYSSNGSIINQGIWEYGKFVRSVTFQQPTASSPSSQIGNALEYERKRLEDERRQLAEERRKFQEDSERKKLEEEKFQLAEERRKFEEEKQKIKKPSNPGNPQKSQPSIKELRCTQLGLIQGSEDYKKCIN